MKSAHPTVRVTFGAHQKLTPPTAIPESPPPSARLTRRSTLFGLAALTTLSFAVFVLTSARTVTGEDSGELISAAYLTGVAHPPGYPLWCILAKLATFLPIGEVAFRVALVSALFGALTVGVLGAIVLLLVPSWPAAIAASLGFGLLRDQWSQTTIAEVYTLNTFFLAACVMLLLLWSERLSWRWFFLFAFTYGLSLTNHSTMLAAAPPFLLFLFIKGWRLIVKWRQLLLATGCFVLGLLPYGYLPLAASRNPAVNWGNPTTLKGVIDHVLRRQYTDTDAELPTQTFARFLEQMGIVWNAAISQGATVLLAAGVIGCGWLLRRRFSLGLVLVGTAVMSTVVLVLQINLQTGFEDAYASRLFFVPAYLVLMIGAGGMVGHLLAKLPKRVAAAAGIAVVVGGIVPPLVTNWRECDYSHYRIVAAHGKRLLDSVPLNAVLFPSSDHNTFPLLYLRFVEGMRPDITIGDKYGYVDPDIAKQAPFTQGLTEKTIRTKEFRAAIEGWAIETWNRPVYFSSKGRLADSATFELVSEGLWYRARRRDTSADLREKADAASWEAIEATPGDEDPRPHDYSAKMVLADLAFARARSQISRGDVGGAFENCSRAAAQVPLSKEVLNNLGSLLAEHRQHEKARPFFRRSIELDPKYLTGGRNLALTYQATHEFEEAKAAFTRVLELERFDPPSNRAMAEIAREESNWGDAAYFLETVGKVERDPRAFRDAGLIALYELKDLARAKALLRASLSLDPNQPEIAEVEQNIKKKGTDDGETAEGKKEKQDGKKPSTHEPDERERAARESAEKAFGLPAPKQPTAPDPLGSLLPKPSMPKVPGAPAGGGGQGAGQQLKPPRPPMPGGGGRN